jgi:hypothetical protein
MAVLEALLSARVLPVMHECSQPTTTLTIIVKSEHHGVEAIYEE